VGNFAINSTGIEISSGGGTPIAAIAADFNGDGLTDLLVANNGDGVFALLLGAPESVPPAEGRAPSALPHDDPGGAVGSVPIEGGQQTVRVVVDRRCSTVLAAWLPALVATALWRARQRRPGECRETPNDPKAQR
jgi:hypothetical protein